MSATAHLIHIVDDDPAIRDALTIVFELEGYDVASFETGEAFLERAARPDNTPGCVILDVHMPGQSGIEILRRLHADRFAAPVFVISGQGDIPMAVEAIKHGAHDFIEKPFEFKKRAFTFPAGERCGQVVARLKGVTHGYGGRELFRDADLELDKGNRVALLGPNGAGKSTLLRLMMGTEEPLKGEARLGEHNIVPNYFTQNQAEDLDLGLTALETLVQAAPDAKLDDIKALLGRMLFSGSGMERKVGALSGGEKARLALAKFMLTPATLLVLDEPTNHLDIPSKEVLEEALRTFEGAVVLASHDRYFLRQVANRIVEVRDQRLVDYKGDYNVFLQENDEEAEAEEVRVGEKKRKDQKKIKAKSKMSKAEKTRLKKEKAKAFQAKKKGGKTKNAGRWS